jgi:hypothetical protein
MASRLLMEGSRCWTFFGEVLVAWALVTGLIVVRSLNLIVMVKRTAGARIFLILECKCYCETEAAVAMELERILLTLGLQTTVVLSNMKLKWRAYYSVGHFRIRLYSLSARKSGRVVSLLAQRIFQHIRECCCRQIERAT